MVRFWTARKGWLAVGIVLIAVLSVGIACGNGWITSWVQNQEFREMLNRETSKGLKLDGRYSPFTRIGELGMHTDSFAGTNGYKTIVALHAEDISGTFNPLGIALQRWELDNIHIKSGSVMLQITEPTPGTPKGPTPRPWWGYFWPYRVHLADVKADDVNVLWHLQEKESGIYHTFLEITPNGRDFEYDARGGDFKTPLTPRLEVLHAHILVRKPRLYCSEFRLGDDPAHPEQQVRLEGEAGLQEDRSVKLKADLTSVDISPWMPTNLRAHVSGHASGHFEYTSTGLGIDTADGHGNIAVANGILHQLPPVQRYITITGSPDPGDLTLKVCQADLSCKNGAITADNINIESDGVFQLQGSITIAKDQTLTGEMEVGLTDPYLKWLPTAKQAIFTREARGYYYTTIRFSGTTHKPKEDLSGRIAKEVEKSPLTALKLFFNQAGDWFNFD